MRNHHALLLYMVHGPAILHALVKSDYLVSYCFITILNLGGNNEIVKYYL